MKNYFQVIIMGQWIKIITVKSLAMFHLSVVETFYFARSFILQASSNNNHLLRLINIQ